MKMQDDVLRGVQTVLGRSIDPHEEGSVGGIHDLTDSDLRDLKAIYDSSLLYAVSYLLFKLMENIHLMDAKSFCEYIGGQGGSLDHWLTMEKKKD
jgi:hypothetical protein